MSSEPIPIHSRFKLGDTVYLLEGGQRAHLGTVRGFDGSGHPVVAVGDDLIPCLGDWLELVAEPSKALPTVADTLAGIASWQREAPMDRDVMIHLKGHVVTATASAFAGSAEAFTGKFLADYTPEAASSCMDTIMLQRSRSPLVFGSKPEPPLGDEPYMVETSILDGGD